MWHEMEGLLAPVATPPKGANKQLNSSLAPSHL